MNTFRKLAARSLLCTLALTGASALSRAADAPPPIIKATLEINGAAAREAYPHLADTFEQLVNAEGKPEDNPIAEKARLATIKFITDAVRKVDMLTYTLSFDKDNLIASSTITPSFMPGKREYGKPNFAPGALFTAHVVYPNSDAANWLPNLLTNLADTDLPFNGGSITPEQLASERKSITDIVALFAAADAESLNVENHGGKIVVTLINQYDRDINVPTQLHADFDAMMTIAKSQGAADAPITFEDISPSDGSKGFRISSPTPGDGGPTAFFCTQKGHVVTFTLSCEANAVPSMVDLSPTDKISALLTAHTDVSAILNLAQTSPMWQMLSPDMQTQVTTLATGKSIDFATFNDGNTENFSFVLPVDLLKICMIIGNNQGTPSPAPTPAPAPAQ